MRRLARFMDQGASLVQSCGVAMLAKGLSEIYMPLAWITMGLFVALVGHSLTPELKAEDRGPEYR